MMARGGSCACVWVCDLRVHRFSVCSSAGAAPARTTTVHTMQGKLFVCVLYICVSYVFLSVFACVYVIERVLQGV